MVAVIVIAIPLFESECLKATFVSPRIDSLFFLLFIRDYLRSSVVVAAPGIPGVSSLRAKLTFGASGRYELLPTYALRRYNPCFARNHGYG